MLTRALQERRLDALVVDSMAVPAGADLSSNRWAGCQRAFFAAEGIPWQAERRLRLDELMAYPIASTTISDPVARGMVERFGPDAHPDRAVTLCCEEIAHLLNVVVRSDAIYLGVLRGARTLESSGKLVRLPFDTKGFDATFGLVRLGGAPSR